MALELLASLLQKMHPGAESHERPLEGDGTAENNNKKPVLKKVTPKKSAVEHICRHCKTKFTNPEAYNKHLTKKHNATEEHVDIPKVTCFLNTKDGNRCNLRQPLPMTRHLETHGIKKPNEKDIQMRFFKSYDGGQSFTDVVFLPRHHPDPDPESYVDYDEYVRGTMNNEDTEETPPASKRPRVDGDQQSSQYDADMTEALSRSLADQGGAATTNTAARVAELQPGCFHWTPALAQEMDTAATADATLEDEEYDADMAEALSRSLADQGGAATTTTTAAARDAEPQPGCSHWGQTSGTPAPAQEADTAPTAAAPPAAPAAAEAATPGSPVYEPPDYEAMYRQLAASNRKLVQELQSSLECPVCLETIRSAPVKCCRNGHLICNVCITRAQICPTCRAPMGISMSMKCVSHVANRLIDLLPHPCTNKDRGCPVEELLTVLTAHETECRYRDVRCPVGYCPDTVPMSSLATHLSSQPHSFPTRGCSGAGVLSHVRALPASTPVSDLNNATFFMRSFDPVRFTHAGAVFYLQTIVSPDRRFLHSFVQLEGSRAECGRWWVRLSVQPCSAFTQSQASVTVRPVTLDHHCRDDLQTIGHAQITPQG